MEIQLTPEMLALVPVVAGIIQMLKKVKYVEPYKDLLPLMAIVISVALVYSVTYLAFLIPAIIVALMAVGGFEMLKSKPSKT